MIAALFVEKGGVYYGRPDVDPWDIERDARKYAGPWPVVAHPPCARWGNYWYGSPSSPLRLVLGDDDGCLASAFASVWRWGGVLEHPAGTRAWRHFRTASPMRGAWQRTVDGAWITEVFQGNYGHPAPKLTWLYCVSTTPPPLLDWSTPPALRPLEHLSKRQRAATPPAFAELLINIAKSAARERTAA